ncbi:DUF2269 family protein [Dehalococcoides mccartyi]|nr:DUF2269 family protein [Dehalococcoides mccartyi]
MTIREILLAVHVIAAVIWIGGGVALNLIAVRLIRTNPELLRPMLKTFDWLVNRTILPASLVVLVFGILLVLEGTYRFEDTFVIIGFIGAVSTIVIGAGFLSPRMRKQDELWEKHGDSSEIASQALSRTMLIARVDIVILFVVIANMVIKPG